LVGVVEGAGHGEDGDGDVLGVGGVLDVGPWYSQAEDLHERSEDVASEAREGDVRIQY